MNTESKRTRLVVGVALLASFFAVLFAMFMPLFDGKNALNYMDALYNSISKDSAYYIPELRETVAGKQLERVELALTFQDARQAELAALLLGKTGATVRSMGSELSVSGDLERILVGCLDDSDLLFRNEGASIEAKYGRGGQEAVRGWWTTLKAMDKELKRQSYFAEAAVVLTVKKKAVECAYNFHGIEPRRIADNLGVVLFSLVFYVVYTVWYGYAIILIFEGCGLKLSH